MAVFNPIVITTAGISLLSQAMAGKGTLTFTSVATSTTVIPYNISNIQAMTALSGIVQTVVPVSVVLKTGNVQVSSIFNNAGITNAYTANTIGLYAALGNGAQTLFAVAIATTPDNIPVQNDLSPSNFYYQFNIAISDTSQLTVTVPEDGSLPASVFNQMFPGITAPDQNNDGDALVYNASSGAWGYVNTETVFTTVSGSGEFVSLQKTLADDFKQIQLFGKSVQAETTGAQLFNVNVCKNEIDLQYKITIDDYATGKITVSMGNPEGAVVMPVNRLSDYCPTMTAGNTYYLSGKHDGSSNGDISLVDVSDTWDFGTSREITEQDLQSAVKFGFGTYSNIMIVEGSTEKPYEVYTGGEAATEPTPEFPLPITSAGNYDEESEKYEVGIGVTGKNLFDASKIPTKTQGGATVTNNNDGSFTVSGSGNISNTYWNVYNLSHEETIQLLKIGIIKLSGVSSTRPNFVAELRNESKAYISLNPSNLTGEITQEMLDDEGVYIRLGFYGTSGLSVVAGAIKPMIYQLGDGTWEPFKQQLSTLQLPNPFRGIPVNSEGNYTDADGQQWICDVVELLTKTLTRYCGVKVFDGSSDENWGIDADTSTKVIRFSIEVENKLNNYNTSLCNRFKNVKGAWYMQDYGIYSDNTNGKTYFRPPNENVDTLNEWKSWLQSNPITVVYQLAIPTEESLTPDQIAALNLTTYQGITNIGTDTMPQVGMAVESRGFNLAGDLAQNLIDLQSTAKSQAESIQALQNTTQTQGGDIQRLEERTGLLEENLQTLDHIIGVPSTSSPVMIPVVTDDGKFTYTPLVDLVYKIGDIKQTTTNVNPGTYLGGTWIPWGTGRTPVGVDADQAEFNTVEKTGGEITHTLDEGEIPEHNHAISADELQGLGLVWVNSNEMEVSSTQGQPHEYMWSEPENTQITCNTNATGGGLPHNNLQPYITCYYWKRTA